MGRCDRGNPWSPSEHEWEVQSRTHGQRHAHSRGGFGPRRIVARTAVDARRPACRRPGARPRAANAGGHPAGRGAAPHLAHPAHLRPHAHRRSRGAGDAAHLPGPGARSVEAAHRSRHRRAAVRAGHAAAPALAARQPLAGAERAAAGGTGRPVRHPRAGLAGRALADGGGGRHGGRVDLAGDRARGEPRGARAARSPSAC